MPIYLRRYYINKISNIHKQQEEASKGKNNDQQTMENFEKLNIDWDQYNDYTQSPNNE